MSWTRPDRLVAMATTALAVALGVVLTGPAANAASIGMLTISVSGTGASHGTDTDSMVADTSAACPAGATAINVTIQGAGFPTSTPFQNVVGNTPVGTLVTNSHGGYSQQFTNTLAAFAGQQTPAATLSGTYTFTFVCHTALSQTDLGDFTGQITFSDPHTWTAAAAAGAPTPTPTTPSPTPTRISPSPTATTTSPSTTPPASTATQTTSTGGGQTVGVSVPGHTTSASTGNGSTSRQLAFTGAGDVPALTVIGLWLVVVGALTVAAARSRGSGRIGRGGHR